MSVTIIGTICFGIKIAGEPGEYPLPWEDEPYEELGEWWVKKVKGFSHPYEDIMYTGIYKDRLNSWPRLPKSRPEDLEKEKICRLAREEFERVNPCPAEVVDYFNNEYILKILAVPSTIIDNMCDPKIFSPADLIVADEQTLQLLKFCKEYGIETEGEPNWYLSAYNGDAS